MPTKTTNGSGGGNWTANSTWVGGVVPSAGDDIVIAAGDTLVLDADVNVGDVDMTAGTIFTTATGKTVDVDGSFLVREGCSVQGLGILSMAVGIGMLEIGPGVGSEVFVTNCTVTCPTLASVNADINLQNSVFADFGLTGGSGHTITGGSFTTISDQATANSDVILSLVTIAGQSGTWNAGDYWTINFSGCSVTGLLMDHLTADFENCTVDTISNTGNTSINYTFADCSITNMSIIAGVGVPVQIPFDNCTFSATAVQGNSSSDICIAVISGQNTIMNGITVYGYGELRVTEELPDAAWASVIIGATNAILDGYILVSSIAFGGNSGVFFGDLGPSVFTVKYNTTLVTPTVNGGTWKVYSTLYFNTGYTANSATNIDLMNKDALFGPDPLVVNYAGLAGPPSPAYRGII